MPVLTPEALSRLEEWISIKMPLLAIKLGLLKSSSWKLKGGAATTARSTSASLLHHMSSRIAPRTRQVLTPPQMCVSWAKASLPLLHHTSCILAGSDESWCCAAAPGSGVESLWICAHGAPTPHYKSSWLKLSMSEELICSFPFCFHRVWPVLLSAGLVSCLSGPWKALGFLAATLQDSCPSSEGRSWQSEVLQGNSIWK